MIDVIKFRSVVSRLIQLLRVSTYEISDSCHFPSDKELAVDLGISTTAFSNLSRGVSSPSAITLIRLVDLCGLRAGDKRTHDIVIKFFE